MSADLEVQTEPCPACNGTGRRLIAPPPAQRGGQSAPRGQGRRHGYEATYNTGCRCELCKAARRSAMQQRRRNVMSGAQS